MKNGQTIHEWNCKCDFCKAGDTAPQNTEERLAELDAKLAGEYVGGMTEYWQRQKDFLLSEEGQVIADVLDGPEQKCRPDDDIVNPPLTREELEYAREYARRIDTELRTYDAHNKPTNP